MSSQSVLTTDPATWALAKEVSARERIDVGGRSRKGTLPPVGDSLEHGRSTRAAQYIRMSTDLQSCSPAVQRDAIAQFAQERGLRIIRTYEDEGCSGLDVAGREGLTALLADVTEGRSDYGVVLVNDISRWGRFQDSDEGAHYEFVCRQRGIRVEYCAEPFPNDGSPMSAVMKSLKRIMAAEFSRELSQKVYTAKCKLARTGFRQGGIAGFGYRRMLVGSGGRPSLVLNQGDRKYLQTDRVTLVLGPQREQDAVRWVFGQIASGKRNPTDIAAVLNRKGLLAQDAREWTGCRIKLMLNNPKYLGCMVFNRTSCKLRTPIVKNPQEQWIFKQGAHPPIVAPELFFRAHAAMSRWASRTSNAKALGDLRDVLAKRGELSARIIEETPGLQLPGFYVARFGSLHRVYQMLGFKPKRDYAYLEDCKARRTRTRELRREVGQALVNRGVRVDWECGQVMTLEGTLRVAVMTCRGRTRLGGTVWEVQIAQRRRADWLLVQRQDTSGAQVLDYRLVRLTGGMTRLSGNHRKQKYRRQENEVTPLIDVLAEWASSARLRRLEAPGATGERPHTAREPDRLRA